MLERSPAKIIPNFRAVICQEVSTKHPQVFARFTRISHSSKSQLLLELTSFIIRWLISPRGSNLSSFSTQGATGWTMTLGSRCSASQLRVSELFPSRSWIFFGWCFRNGWFETVGVRKTAWESEKESWKKLPYTKWSYPKYPKMAWKWQVEIWIQEEWKFKSWKTTNAAAWEL